MVNNSLAKAGDLGLIPGLGRFLGEGNDNLFQYSCLGNPMNRGMWWAAVHGLQRVGHDLATEQQQSNCQWGFPGGTAVKNPHANAGDARESGLILGWEDPAREGTSNPLQYSCLGNPMNRGAWWAIVRGVANS